MLGHGSAPEASEPGECVEGDSGGRRHVQRVDPVHDRNRDNNIGHRQGGFRQARPLGPEKQGHTNGVIGAGHLGLQFGETDGRDSAVGRRTWGQGGDDETGRPHLEQPGRPRRQPGERHVQDMSDGHPDRPAVERVGTGGVQKNTGYPESGGIAEQGADVLVVVEALEDGDKGRDLPRQPVRPRRRPVAVLHRWGRGGWPRPQHLGAG